MHDEARDYVSRMVAALPQRRRVVEIGGRNVNGGVLDLFGECEYICTDIEAGEGVSVVTDGATYVPPWAPDTVVCCEVLEHAANAHAIVINAHRMLAAGGVFIVTAAAPPRAEHSGYDGQPWLFEGEHYANITEQELTDWCYPLFASLTVEYDSEHGDIRTLAIKAQELRTDTYINWEEV